MSMSEAVIVYTTFPDMAAAQQVCKTVIAERLAACANIFPSMTAIYEWQGTLETEQECAVFLKTRQSAAENLMRHLKREHPYDTPAILVIPLSAVDQDYGAWISQQIGTAGKL